jgi:hypothetical protein
MLNYNAWIEKQWTSHKFFDPRLHKRVVNIAQAMIKTPKASIPERFTLQKDVKGCYRFLNNKAINHQMLQSQHYENVLKEATIAQGRVLFIQDSSELIYNNLKWTDLGPTSDSCGNGIMFHSCLAVKFQDDQPLVIGLTGQKAWIRESIKGGSKKDQDEKESHVWKEMLDQIGPVPKNCKWTTVGDRGADIFSFLESLPPGWDCVIRSKHDRKILVKEEQKTLKEYLRSLPCGGTTTHFLRARKGSSNQVMLKISWTDVKVLPPDALKGKNPVKGCYVRAWCEENPDIEWILFTRSSITSFEEALETVTIYRHRWIIEEYHKCLKTGCQIEEAQLGTADGLLALFGILGVIATQLLQLKNITRINPDDPAEKHVDPVSIAVLQSIYNLKGPMTVKEYWRRVAMLVGFAGRKSDGNPGWQKIWKGWIKLRDLCQGVEIGRRLRAQLG